MILHLNGWPGVGKQTVGRIVAGRLGDRFVHNHLLHDLAINCTGVSDPARWELHEEVRRAAYRQLRLRPPTEVFVMTNALCAGTPREVEAWNHIVDLAVGRGVPLVPIVLTAAPDENVRRLESPERLGRKMTDGAALRALLASDRIQVPSVRETAAIDVTLKSPEAVRTTSFATSRASASRVDLTLPLTLTASSAVNLSASADRTFASAADSATQQHEEGC